MTGGSNITFEQMKAYNDIMGEVIGPIEAQIIQKLDREYLRIMNG